MIYYFSIFVTIHSGLSLLLPHRLLDLLLHQKLPCWCWSQPRSNTVSVNNVPLCPFTYAADNYPLVWFTLLSHPLWFPGSDKGFPTIPQALPMPHELPPSASSCPWVPCVWCPSPVSLNHPPLRLNMLLSPSCTDVFVAPASVSRCYGGWPLQQRPVLYDSNPFDSEHLIEC